MRQEPGVALGQAAVSRRMLWKLPLNVPVTAPPSLQHPTDRGGGTESIPWVGRGHFPHSLIFYFLFFSQGLQTLGCEFPGIPTCTKGRWPLSTQRGMPCAAAGPVTTGLTPAVPQRFPGAG